MELVTARLILREFEEDDWRAVLGYQSDPLYLRYYEWNGRTPQEVQAFVQMFMEQQKTQPRTKFQLAVTLKSSGRLIGNCGVRITSAAARAGEIGYELDPHYWDQGYATEAARAMLEFGFTELGLLRIRGVTIAENSGSVRVLEKLGMRLDERQSSAEYYKGRWWDRLVYVIREDVWRALN